MKNLPDEMMQKLFSFFTQENLITASQVCTNFRNNANDPSIWKNRLPTDLSKETHKRLAQGQILPTQVAANKPILDKAKKDPMLTAEQRRHLSDPLMEPLMLGEYFGIENVKNLEDKQITYITTLADLIFANILLPIDAENLKDEVFNTLNDNCLRPLLFDKSLSIPLAKKLTIPEKDILRDKRSHFIIHNGYDINKLIKLTFKERDELYEMFKEKQENSSLKSKC